MKKFLQKHLIKIILGIIITFLGLYFLINPKDTRSLIGLGVFLLDQITPTFFTTVVAALISWLLFFIHKGTAKELEKLLLGNLTTACSLSILLIGYQGISGNLTKEFTLTGIGAILVFWYGYKRYERTLDITYYERFKEEYKLLITDKKFAKIIYFWRDYYYLYNRGYISKDIWNIIAENIEMQTKSFLQMDFYIFHNKLDETTFIKGYDEYNEDFFNHMMTSRSVMNANEDFINFSDKFHLFLATLIARFLTSHNIAINDNGKSFRNWKKEIFKEHAYLAEDFPLK